MHDDKIKVGIFILFILALLAFSLWAVDVSAGEGCDTAELAGVTEAVTFLINRNPHPLQGNSDRIAEIALALCDAGAKYDVDPYLLTSMAWFESRFRPDVLSLKTTGSAGEKGLLQVGRQGAASCPHFMHDVAGQALCGARWLAMARRECGDGATDKQGLAMYAGGRGCAVSGDKHLAWVVARRINLRNRLKNMVEN